jgi:hypothetical protein
MLKLKDEFNPKLTVTKDEAKGVPSDILSEAKPTQNSGKRGRVENLKPWKPGQSGNPGGRPKIIGQTLEQRLLEVIECEIRDPLNPRKRIPFKGRRLDMIINALINNAASMYPHQVAAFREIRQILEPTASELGAAGKSEGSPDMGLIREFARRFMERQRLVKTIDIP